ncbi:MAG: aminotransferase class IV [Candidatus Rokubacteria bacterium]|nr:aminotransferase class IV [Candidatus Rokubacteria bacterium]
MSERIVYINRQLVPESKAVISVFDRSVQWGDAVYDASRTFNHRPFKLREHIERLYRSCRYTRMPIEMSMDEMEKHTLEVIDHNMSLLAKNEDDMVWWSVTRGVNPITRGVLDCREATVIIYTFPVPFKAFAKFIERGARVVTPSVRRIPPQCLDPKAKISNKMNHILADLEAKGADPEAYSLMLDINGNIAENSGGNFFWVRDGRLWTSSRYNILEGVTRGTVIDLANAAGLHVVEGDFTVYDVYTADEAFLTTSTYCILPVSRLNGAPIGRETPGRVTKSLIKGWSDLVGIDIVAQTLSHAG